MADIAELGIRVDSRQVRQGTQALDELGRRGQRTERDINSLEGVVKSLGKGLAALGLLIKAIDFGSAVIQAQRDFDKLNSSLITATGSIGNAGQAFAALQRFAANTPYDLQQTTKAFIQLRNLGLTPSERALTSYGNTAAAMSKDLSQMVEAVADAATGEFERLKEFGIKASQQGDKVALTFQGTTTTIANNAQAIEDYLIRLGETKFAGGMELQARTLDGALAGLADTWDMTLLAFAQSGLGDATHESVLGLSGALVDLQAIIRSFNNDIDDQKKKIEELSPLHEALTEIFTTSAVVAANVGYVFKAVGKDIGAFAATIVALARGDWDEAKRIAGMRKQEAAEERQMIDAQTEKIRWAAAVAKKVRENEAAEKDREKTDDLARYAVQREAITQQTDAQKKAAKDRAKAAQDAAQWYKHTTQAFEESIAMARAELDAVGELTPAQREEIKIRQEMARVAGLLTPKQKAVIDGHLVELSALELLNAEREHAAQLMRDQGADNASAIKAADDETKALEDRIKYFGLTEAAVLRLKAAELERQMAGAEGNALEIDRLFRLLAATEDQIALQEQLSRMEADAAFWKSLDDTARDTFRSIEDGGKGIWQRIKESAQNVFFDWLYQMTAKKWILNLQASADGSGAGGIVSAIGGALGGGGGDGSGMGSMMNLLSMGKSLYSMFTGGLVSSMGSAVTSLGTTFGSAAVAEFGAGMSGVAGTGLASGTAAGAGASFASAVPIIGWIIGGMMANNKFFKQGWNIDGQSTDITKSLLGSTLKGNPFGLLGGGMTIGINGANTLLKKIGLSDQLASLLSGSSLWARAFGHQKPTIESQGLSGEFNNGGVLAENWANILQKGGWFRSDKHSTIKGAADGEFAQGLTETFAQMKGAAASLADVLGVSTDNLDAFKYAFNITFDADETKREQQVADMLAGLGDALATYLVPNIAQFSAEGETATATLQRLATEFQATNAIMQAIGVDGAKAFGAVGLASIEARERLIALAGGVDQLATMTDYFAQNFMTDAERLAPVQKAVAEQMAALGYAGVVTADQFKGAVMDIINGGGLATEQGAKTYASLLAIAPQFKAVADAAAAAREKTASLEEQIFALTHTDGEVLARQRDAELAALSATDRALQLRIYALQDEAAAAAAATAALESNEVSLRAFVDSAMDAVQRAVEAQRKQVQAAYDAGMAALQVRIDGVTTTISALNELAGVLKNGLSSMTMQGTETATRAAAQAQIEAALAIARAGGALPTADSIRDAVGLASKTSTDDFSSFIEYQRDFVRTSSALAELAGLTDGQMTDAQKQLAALNAEKDLLADWYKQQTESLDAALEKAQEQVDAINGVNTSVLSVAQALGLLAASIGNLKNGATPSNPTGTGMTMEQLYQTVLGRAPDAAGAAYWAPIFGDSIDEDDIRNFINGAQGELAGRVPGFANGGSHAGGWRFVGETGVELENTGPSHITSNGGVQDLFGGLEARIESLETTLAVGLTRLIDETKRGADASEEIADNTSDEEVIG